MLSILFWFTLSGYSQQYNFRHFTDALTQPYVYSIIQDNQGYLWIGTGNGLLKYNGFAFQTYSTHDSLADNFITCSYKRDNDLWFGHMNGNISHFDGEQFHPIHHLENKASITAIKESPDGNLWAASYSNGLWPINEISDKHETIESPIIMMTFAFISNDYILIGSDKGLIHGKLLQSGKIEIVNHITEIPKTRISDIIKMKNDSGYFVATKNTGIYKVTPKNDGFKVQNITQHLHTELTQVQSILEDSHSNLWISTFGQGLVKINTSSDPIGKVKYFKDLPGFTAENVKTIYEDREGNIWSGNYGSGMTQISKKGIAHYPLTEIENSISVHAVYTGNNYIWIGTDNNLLKLELETQKILASFSSAHGLPNDKITSIYSDSDEIKWIGTENNGIYRSNGENSFIPVYIGDGQLENSITAITGKNDEIWIGTKKGVCYLKLNTTKLIEKKWFTIDRGGLPHNYINHLFLDSKDNVWISTIGNTLAVIKDGQVEKITIDSEKGILSFGTITEDADSTIWIGSFGGGVFRIQSDSVANITSQQGLFSNYCYSVLADNQNNVWISHRGGLSKISTNNLLIASMHQPAGINPGCEFTENSITQDNNNRIWFGSNQGLWSYNPLEDTQSTLPPILNITSIKVNNRKVGYNNELTLSPGNYNLTIDYIGTYLSEPTNVNYQYQLKGYDSNPIKTKERSVTYQHLTEGNYTFILQAYTSDGATTNVPVQMHLTIKTPIWKKWWFYVVGTLILAGLVMGYIKRREYKYLQEKSMLEKQVNIRTKELAEKNTILEKIQKQITDQNNELQQYRNYLEDLVGERTRELTIAKNKAEESDRLKTAFLQNMSHEIRTPMNGILGFLNLLQDPDMDEMSKNESIKIINESGKRLLNTINDIVEISKIEARQIKVHNTFVYLTDMMDYLFKFFEPQTKAKGLSLIINEHIKGSDAFVETDHNILNNILTNLINNAVKFTQQGTVEFGNYLEDHSLVFYVKDSGIGIPRNRTDAIFERFVQADLNSTREYEGSGLGLSIVKAYVEILNGKIWLTSEVEKGSTFFFSIPYTPVSKNNDIKKQAHPIPILKTNPKLKVLIAEDDEYSYLFLKTILKNITSEILHARNGQEAIQLLHENPDVSLVLMDMKMPKLNGYDAVKEIRQFNQTIPIIAQTAYAISDDRNKVIEAGCNDYITKPINCTELIEVIQKYLYNPSEDLKNR